MSNFEHHCQFSLHEPELLPGKAIECFEKAIELKPDYAEAYGNMGIVLGIMKRLDEAVKCFEKAIELKPDYADAYSNIGISLTELGRYDEAIKCFEKAIELKPDYA